MTSPSGLDAIDGPVAIELTLRVAGPDAQRSPLTGELAAVVVLSLLEGGRELGRAVLASDLVLMDERGREVLVPRHSLRVTEADGVTAEQVDRVPAELSAYLMLAKGGPLSVRETRVVRGERVQLSAWLARASPGNALLVARADLGPVVIRFGNVPLAV